MGHKHYIALVAKLVLTILALYYLQLKVDLAAAAIAISAANPLALFGALLLQAIQILLCSMRWQVILRAMRARLPFWNSVVLFSISTFFSQVLPGAVGGDAIRVWKTSQAGLSFRLSANSVILERIVTVLGLILLVVICQPMLASRLPDRTILWVFPTLAIAGIGFLLLLTNIPRKLRHLRIIRIFSWLSDDCRSLFLHPIKIIYLVTIVLIAHVNLAMIVWVLALGLGSHISFGDCLALLPPAVLVATLPISIAGWGTREVAMIWLFGLIGMSTHQATALSVLFGLSGLAISLPGGVAWFLSKRKSPLPTFFKGGGK